ncbi:type II 3-dehydroquinate dehydratase [Paraburkholderia sp. BL10I2N1]|uniref:type II 3-dehydroquinate dehydratase n=1 Tax=Paraburkholderia sp. BL10I2N1 TaxID=1938796 RepID=UPI0010F1A6C4|nr:3-dehydroquinate dehydratase [Paraburkholderia sp. BL10I2N1]
MKKILMLHGINHNMFGKRDSVQYGTITLAEIDARLQAPTTDERRCRVSLDRVTNVLRSAVRPQQQGARRRLHLLHGTAGVVPLPAQTLRNSAKREPLLCDQSVAI